MSTTASIFKTNDSRHRAQYVQVVGNEWINEAIESIKNETGLDVRLKNQGILKFGAIDNPPRDEFATLMTLPGTENNETYVSTNIIDTVSSDSASDTRLVSIKGLTVNGGLFTVVTQTALLEGQDKCTLTTPLARVSNIENIDSVDLVGNVFVYQNGPISGGAPDLDSSVHIMIQAGKNASIKAADTVPNRDFILITSVYAGVSSNIGSAVTSDLELQVRKTGSVFNTILCFNCKNSGCQYDQLDFAPYLLAPQNSDVRLIGRPSSNSSNIFSGFNATVLTVNDKFIL